jgi:hypothetical protein
VKARQINLDSIALCLATSETTLRLGKFGRRAITAPPPQGVCHTPLHSDFVWELILRPSRSLRQFSDAEYRHPVAATATLR